LELILLFSILIFLTGCFGSNPFDPGNEDPVDIPDDPGILPPSDPEPHLEPEPIPELEPILDSDSELDEDDLESEANSDLCNDSDGGIIYNVRGIAFENPRIVDGIAIAGSGVARDSCDQRTRKLNEHYCKGGEIQSIWGFDCDSLGRECYDGACMTTDEIGELEKNQIKITGKLVDMVTNEPISGAILKSSSHFSPDNVVTDSNGNFEFFANGGTEGRFYFNDECHGVGGQIQFSRNLPWITAGVPSNYKYAVQKNNLHKGTEILEVDGLDTIDVGVVVSWPVASVKFKSDIPAKYDSDSHYEDSDGNYGGGGTDVREEFTKEHSILKYLSLDYDYTITIRDELGNEYISEPYRIPFEVGCGTMQLDFSNGEFEWSIVS
jgi:hypothetical protein